MLAGLARLTCLHCAQPLSTATYALDSITCGHCGAIYPVVDARVPVLTTEPLQTLAGAYLLHDQHLREARQTIERLEAQARQHPAASPSLQRMARAHEVNLAPFQRLQQVLRPFIRPEQLLTAFRENASSTYGVLLSYYLEKDWSGQPATEAELAIKLAPVLAQSRAHAPDLESVLVLGAGAGRIVWELGYVYQQVYAVDNSLLMPYNFGRLREEPIPFVSIKANNVLEERYKTRALTASLDACGHDPATFQANAERITYFLGDATRLPLADQSQSALVSVYFTDVLPLRVYLAEARRVLKPGGIFIHVGPLIYHFDDESQMLTPDEVLAVFREYGFVIETNEFTTSPSSTTAGTMVSTAYMNWVFTAICPPTRPPAPLTLDTVLALAAPLSYELHGQLAPAAEEAPPVVLLQLPTGNKLKVSPMLLDLLHLLNCANSLRQAVALLEEGYELPEQAHPILFASLQQLLDMKVLVVA